MVFCLSINLNVQLITDEDDRCIFISFISLWKRFMGKFLIIILTQSTSAVLLCPSNFEFQDLLIDLWISFQFILCFSFVLSCLFFIVVFQWTDHNRHWKDSTMSSTHWDCYLFFNQCQKYHAYLPKCLKWHKHSLPVDVLSLFNSLRPSDVIWQHRSGSTLAQVMACCLTAPSHYLNQCWLIISKV